ncbi:MAG: hypothetical protein J6Y38_02660 [Bacteroidaceae bacterium]|nr:hypothetical protein [Bacteroidaceae bacterium]
MLLLTLQFHKIFADVVSDADNLLLIQTSAIDGIEQKLHVKTTDELMYQVHLLRV